jgi:K+ transporter
MELEGRKATQPNGIRALLTLSLAALGIIYSDIGTLFLLHLYTDVLIIADLVLDLT